MTDRSRNLIVGLTILVATIVLLTGMSLLGKIPSFGGGKLYKVTLVADDANGVTQGSSVNLNGYQVGSVTSVQLTVNSNRLGARIVVELDPSIQIPANATARLSKPITGVGSPEVDLKGIDMSKTLPQDGSAILVALPGDAGLIPDSTIALANSALSRLDKGIEPTLQQITSSARQIDTAARDLHVLLDYAPPEAVDAANPNDPNRVRENVSTAIVRIDRMAKSLQELLADPTLQGQVRLAVQNISDASTQLKSTLQKVDAVVDSAQVGISAIGAAATQASSTFQVTQKEISRVSQSLVEVMAQLQKTTQQLSEGSGTTGRLINDPRLYDSLLDLTKSLKSSSDQLDFLLKKWKDEGVNLHL